MENKKGTDLGYVNIHNKLTRINLPKCPVVKLRINKEVLFCPVYTEGPMYLEPVQVTDDGKFFIDATNEFGYELWTSMSLHDRIAEFNAEYEKRDNIPLHIVGIATYDELNNLGIPAYRENAYKTGNDMCYIDLYT